MTARTKSELTEAYHMMRQHFGHQHWWPGETPFEVCVGAILTQNTNWTNVERAITRLKQAQVLAPDKLLQVPESTLAHLIRSAGYYNLKAKRLRAFLHVLVGTFQGEVKRLMDGPTKEVRQRLLAIYGIGPETADSMLLYAGEHPSFVVDAYTKRVFLRHGWWAPSHAVRPPAHKPTGKGNTTQEYDSLKALCETAMAETPATMDRLDYWQDYHAQLVMIGKNYCRNRQPDCHSCPLLQWLPKTVRKTAGP